MTTHENSITPDNLVAACNVCGINVHACAFCKGTGKVHPAQTMKLRSPEEQKEYEAKIADTWVDCWKCNGKKARPKIFPCGIHRDDCECPYETIEEYNKAMERWKPDFSKISSALADIGD